MLLKNHKEEKLLLQFCMYFKQKKKKIHFKYTHAFQTIAVQRSTVFLILIEMHNT